ncbi:MAG: hypothetical protein KGL35_27910 [Bradyrhizobium sp.]|nr:hypothetical protein [Bradyrhizobium sp.]
MQRISSGPAIAKTRKRVRDLTELDSVGCGALSVAGISAGPIHRRPAVKMAHARALFAAGRAGGRESGAGLLYKSMMRPISLDFTYLFFGVTIDCKGGSR